MADDTKPTYKSSFDYANRTPYQDLIQSRYMNYQPFDALAPMQMYQNYQNGILPTQQAPQPAPQPAPMPDPTPTPDPVVDPIAAWLSYDLNGNGRLGRKERRAFRSADLAGFQDWRGMGGNNPAMPSAQGVNPPMPGTAAPSGFGKGGK